MDITNKAVIADNAHETYKCVTVEPYYDKNIVEDSLGYYTEVFENSQTTSGSSYETTANSVLMLNQYTHNLVSDQQVKITDAYSGSGDIITYVNQKGILVGNSKYYN